MNSVFRSSFRFTSNQTRHYSTATTTSSRSGGVISFLVGVTVAGAAGYWYLLGEFKNSSESLLISIKELQSSTDKVKEYAHKIETVHKDVSALKQSSATKQELAELSKEAHKLYDTLNIDHLELKTHIWGLGISCLDKEMLHNQLIDRIETNAK